MQRDQILVFCYHKTGTVLLRGILTGMAELFGLRRVELYGMVPRIDPSVDIAMLCHSLLGVTPARPFRGVRIVRDPRDIWISGYLHHCHCTEPWCVSTDFSTDPPIRVPQVPAPFVHRRERWKRDFLTGLGGISYQENLLKRDREAGMAFELAHYTAVTLEDMRRWALRPAGVLDVQMERIATDFDAAMEQIFSHLGFDGAELRDVLDMAAQHDVARMSEAAVDANPHIHGRSLSKWQSMLTPEQIAQFERQYGDLIVDLGYRLSPAAG